MILSAASGSLEIGRENGHPQESDQENAKQEGQPPCADHPGNCDSPEQEHRDEMAWLHTCILVPIEYRACVAVGDGAEVILRLDSQCFL
jgi:hypothetical protein